jgi:hypothetical protein
VPHWTDDSDGRVPLDSKLNLAPGSTEHHTEHLPPTPFALMTTDIQSPPSATRNLRIGFAFLMAGLAGHLLAAQAIGGTVVAYRDHILGFVLLSVVSGAVLALLGRWFWRGRHDLTLLWVGVLQALLGVVVYIERFSVHG